MSEPNDYVARCEAKAAEAAHAARLLLGVGDFEGTCDRAYHAMYFSARAALAKAVPDREYVSDSAVVAAFGRHLVRDGVLPRELGRAIQRRPQNVGHRDMGGRLDH